MGSARRIITACAFGILVMTSCGSSDNSDATARLEITALSGPVCPVETDPPSPDCAPRPVEGATMVVTDSGGTEVARGATGADGKVGINVPPGDLAIVPQPVEGLLGTAPRISVTVADGESLGVTADYDTGIR